jgi:phage terminase large subunit-like protein
VPEALTGLEPLQLAGLDHDWFGLWARADQKPPIDGSWRNWLILGGRGAGKTRAGAEWVKARATGQGLDTGPLARRIALVAPTFDEARMVMIEGVSGLLAIHDESWRPVFEPTKRLLTWPNGCVAHVFSAEEPDGLRGPQFDAAWCDELAKWKHAGAVWDMLAVGMGGYIGGRSVEKITNQIFGAVPGKRK